ncbi:MAG TPA: metallophosphoesterase [Micromonosporaceae bacterium]
MDAPMNAHRRWTTAISTRLGVVGRWLAGTRQWPAAVLRWQRGTAGRRISLGTALLLITLAGVSLGVLVGGHVRAPVGPFDADMSVTPSLHGGTEVRLPPLGSLHLRSHDGPAHLSIDLAALDNGRTLELLSRPDGVERASSTAVGDLRAGVGRLALQTTAVAVLGAMLLAAVVFRSMRRVAICGGLALAVMVGSLGIAAASFRRQSIAEPTYEGLLTNARSVVGDARQIADRYDAYRDQLQKLVTNVSRLYATVSTLPVYQPSDGTIKVLHVSDLHLNPAAWSIIRTVATQFDIDVVVDTGDITDWGSEPETSFVAQIGTLGVPYVYIRGNHDSARTQTAISQQRHAVVLDNQVADVAGLRIAGIGDPRFTPDKGSQEPDERVRAGLSYVGRQLASTISDQSAPVDLALVHDPTSAGPLAGVVPVVLAGHTHEASMSELPVTGPSRVPRTHLLVEGSTGGAGLRGLEADQPVPLQLSVLYFSPDHTLQAYDQISVGGTGQAEVRLERHLLGGTVGAIRPTPTR